MRKAARPLLVLHDDPVFAREVERLRELGFIPIRVHAWDELAQRLNTATPVTLAVVDPYAGQPRGGPLAPELARIRRTFPSTTMVAALSPRTGWVSDARTLGEWGVAEVIDLSTEGTREGVRRRLANVRGRPIRALLERAAQLWTPSRARAVLDASVEVVGLGGGPRTLARTLGLSPATLIRWCATAGLPVPRRLLMWIRVLLAAEMLDDPGRSVLNVALTCGYSSDRALRRALYATVGRGPRAMRGAGAFATAARQFRRELGADTRSHAAVG